MDNLFSLIMNKEHRDATAILYKRNNKICSLTYSELFDYVSRFAKVLDFSGLKKGDRVGIMIENSPEFIISDLACIKKGLISIPIPTKISNENLSYIINDSEINLMISFRKINFKKLFLIDFNESIEKNLFNISKKQAKSSKIESQEIATICYTSGSTGVPKGVVLTHKNIISNILSQPFDLSYKDTIISYLPISHMFERTGGYYSCLYNRVKIAISSPDTLLDDLSVYKPTIMLAVPRVLEKVYNAVNEKKFARTVSKLPIARKFVAKKLKARFGGRLRFIICGGSHLDKEVCNFFWKLGIRVFEGYGMTETSPVISVNYEQDYKIGSVGRPLRDVEINVNNGRLFVKTPGMMMGYLRNKKILNDRLVNGWLDTGDIAKIDEEGFLYILGRADDLIVMSNGKKTYPEHIEKKLEKSKHVNQAFVFGDNKPFITAIIHSNSSEEEVKSIVESINKELNSWETIKKFKLISEPFSVENNTLTHTLKLKRKSIYKRHFQIIEGLYKNENSIGSARRIGKGGI